MNTSQTKSADKSTIAVAGEFVFLQTLIDCLLRMQPREQDKNELKSHLEEEYKNNQSALDKLHAVNTDYSSEHVLHLYTSESIFYIPINTALRTKDIHMMFLWRSYLADIRQQLAKGQLKNKITVYRGQRISKTELNALQASIGSLISINSFLSTSCDRAVALMFADPQQLPEDMETVLFEIEADPVMVEAMPFADISDVSQYPDEREILFMFGSIFRVQSVNREAGSTYTIKMSLCDDDDQDVKEILKYMQEQNGPGATTLFTLAKLVWTMSHYSLAERYYESFLENLQPDDPRRLSVYEDMAAIKSQQGNFDAGLEWQRRGREWKLLHRPVYDNCQRKSLRMFLS